MHDDVLPHLGGDEVFEFRVGLSGQQLFCWWFSGEGEGSHGVHDQVDPEHLNGAEGGFLKNGGTCKGKDQSAAVDS